MHSSPNPTPSQRIPSSFRESCIGGAWGHSRHVGPSRECLAGAGHGVMANIGRPARVIFDIQAGPVARKGRSGVSPAYEPHSLEAGRLLSSLQSKP